LLWDLTLLGRYLWETHIDWVCQQCGDQVCENQQGQSSRYFCLYFIVMELVEMVLQIVYRLRNSAIHNRYRSSLLHEVCDLGDWVLEQRSMLHIRSQVVKWEHHGPKWHITHHQRYHTYLNQLSKVFCRNILRIQLNELLAYFKWRFS
jgi:hypothetical protein